MICLGSPIRAFRLESLWYCHGLSSPQVSGVVLGSARARNGRVSCCRTGNVCCIHTEG